MSHQDTGVGKSPQFRKTRKKEFFGRRGRGRVMTQTNESRELRQIGSLFTLIKKV